MRVVARAHVVVTRGVAHRTREATEHDRAGPEARVRAARDAAVRALHAEQARVAGGDADRSAAVAAGRERHEPARHRGRAARRRAAERASVPPRVVRHAVELRHAHVEPAELARGREPDRHDAARGEQPLDHGRRRASRSGRGTRATPRSRASPTTDSSSLIPTGTPPNGRRHVGVARRRRVARSGSRNENALRSLAAIAASDASSSSTGDRSLAPERVDERAGVVEPRGSRTASCQSSCRSAAEMSGTAIFASAPPSAGRFTPVTNAASSDARNSATLAMSSGKPEAREVQRPRRGPDHRVVHHLERTLAREHHAAHDRVHPDAVARELDRERTRAAR